MRSTEFLIDVAGVCDADGLADALGVMDVLGQYNVMRVVIDGKPMIKFMPVTYQVVGHGPSQPATHVLRVRVDVLARVSIQE